MSPTQEPPSTILIRIKVPPGHLHSDTSADEFELGIFPTNAPINTIRDSIHRRLPSHPIPERQRLLYAGRALVDNEQSLADALNIRRDPGQTAYVVHLIVRGEHGTQNGQGLEQRRQANTASVPLPGPGVAPSQVLRPETGPGGQGPPNIWTDFQNMNPNQHVMNNVGLAVQWQLLQRQQAQAQQLHQQLQLQQQQRQQAQQQEQQQQRSSGSATDRSAATEQPVASSISHGSTAEAQIPQPEHVLPSATSSSQAVPITSQPGQQNTEQASRDGTNSENRTHPQDPRRPVSGQGFHMEGVGSNGQRFSIHQHTVNLPGIPLAAPNGMQLPLMGHPIGLPFPPPGTMPRLPQPSNIQATGPSALDRARENITEMQRILEELRTAENAPEGNRTRVDQLEGRIQAINDYIDPFRLGGNGATSIERGPPHHAVANNQRWPPPAFAAYRQGPQPLPLINNRFGTPQHGLRAHQQSTGQTDVQCYLLSSPTGPSALLFSPQHGQFVSSHSNITHPAPGILGSTLNGTLSPVPPSLPDLRGQNAVPTSGPTQSAGPAGVPAQNEAGGPNHNQDGVVAPQIAQQPAQAQPADPLGPMQPILAHFWLLLRILIFVYFLLGANMGWRRPIALLLIGLGFWMIRMGVFGAGGIGRRWWEGIVHVDGMPRAPGPLAQGQPPAQGADAAQPNAPAGNAHPAARAPGDDNLPLTPEQLAQRLMHRQQENLNRAPLHRLREQVRPLERALALFIASLWPGIGEGYVRRLERAERERNEAEVRRREEAERQQAEQDSHAKDKEESERITEGQDKTAVKSDEGSPSGDAQAAGQQD